MTSYTIEELYHQNATILFLIDMLDDMYWDNVERLADLGDQKSIDLIREVEATLWKNMSVWFNIILNHYEVIRYEKSRNIDACCQPA